MQRLLQSRPFAGMGNMKIASPRFLASTLTPQPQRQQARCRAPPSLQCPSSHRATCTACAAIAETIHDPTGQEPLVETPPSNPPPIPQRSCSSEHGFSSALTPPKRSTYPPHPLVRSPARCLAPHPRPPAPLRVGSRRQQRTRPRRAGHAAPHRAEVNTTATLDRRPGGDARMTARACGTGAAGCGRAKGRRTEGVLVRGVR